MENKAKSCFYCSHRPSFHWCWQIQGVSSSEPVSFCQGEFLVGRCLGVQQAVSPVPCSACKLASQPASLHPPGISACHYIPLKREEEKEMLRDHFPLRLLNHITTTLQTSEPVPTSSKSMKNYPVVSRISRLCHFFIPVKN